MLMSSRLLVVATSNVTADEASSAVSNRLDEGAEVRVVAPASNLSRLDWLTNAEDDARDEAASRADEIADRIPTDAVESEVGDTVPAQAIEDAIRTFKPDEIVLVTKGDDDATWLEIGADEAARRRLHVPITHIVVS
jgi:GABA permease